MLILNHKIIKLYEYKHVQLLTDPLEAFPVTRSVMAENSMTKLFCFVKQLKEKSLPAS